MDHSSESNGDCHLREKYGSCEGLPFYRKWEGKRYCVLHFPAEEKSADTQFQEAVESKCKAQNFRFEGVYFPSFFEGFAGFNFEGDAYFNDATFKGTARFYDRATFKGVASFVGATFEGDAYFSSANFEGDSPFVRATFKERAAFLGLKTLLKTVFSFRDTTIEKPERISFHSTYLRPNWFIDVDAQKFDFTDVHWFELPNGDKLSLEAEIEHLRTRGIQRIEKPQSLRMLSRACRRLMNNAEESRDYPTANEFHYWSMEAQRKKGWSRLGLIATLYWALSGYGERPLRAFGVLIAIWLAFAAVYVLLPSSPFWAFLASDFWGLASNVGQAVVYSLSALARLSPEPKPTPGLFQFVVTLEGLLGPLQIALFLLAVRRRVMR